MLLFCKFELSSCSLLLVIGVVMLVEYSQAEQLIDPSTGKILSSKLRELCLGYGADDVGFVDINRTELDDQRSDIQKAFPSTKTLISIVGKMNREPVRNPYRSIANLEFHQTTDLLNETARSIVRALESLGIRAINHPAGFPMEMENFPGKVWLVSHKPVAEAAGLGSDGNSSQCNPPKVR